MLLTLVLMAIYFCLRTRKGQGGRFSQPSLAPSQPTVDPDYAVPSLYYSSPIFNRPFSEEIGEYQRVGERTEQGHTYSSLDNIKTEQL